MNISGPIKIGNAKVIIFLHPDQKSFKFPPRDGVIRNIQELNGALIKAQGRHYGLGINFYPNYIFAFASGILFQDIEIADHLFLPDIYTRYRKYIKTVPIILPPNIQRKLFNELKEVLK